MKKDLEDIAGRNGRFSPRAVKFVYEGLGYTAKKVITKDIRLSSVEAPDHISGQALCVGLRRLAVEKWGRLAMLVLGSWGIRTTRDFGEIVYLMIRHNWMSAQSNDSIDDFNDVYDFKTVFKDQFKL